MEKINLSQFYTSTSYDPAAAAQAKADNINDAVGELTGYNCPTCRNRGYIAYPRCEDGNVTIRDCTCMSIRRSVWEMEKSGLRNIIREKTFDTFTATDEWQQRIKAGAMKYVAAPEGWFLICGQSGSGKTHLCTAICRERLLAHDTVRYMSWRDKSAEIKAAALDSEQRASLISGFKQARILYIDDLFKTADGASPTPADIGLAFELLNYRYINCAPTLISTERTPQELIALDEATGGRIIEQAGENVFSIARDARRNYRLRRVVAV